MMEKIEVKRTGLMAPLVTSGPVSASSPASALTTHTLVGAQPSLSHAAHLASLYAPGYPDPPPPYQLPTLGGGEQSAFYSPTAAGLELKESLAASPMGPTWPYPSMYYPYDTALASYPFAGYGMGLDAARRKNATREATATLKAWLNEHKKNPYPTKGEKIMLAIITKMTLTQVSTWFANARRRLKKENKMTWEPRSKTDEDDDDDDDKDDDKLNEKDDKDDDHDKKLDPDGIYSDSEDKKKESESLLLSGSASSLLRGVGSPGTPPTDVIHPKPRIWSLADMATSGSFSSGSAGNGPLSVGAGKIMPGGMTRGLHLEGAPYPRPLFAHGAYPYIPNVSESLLTYSKSLVANFPPVSLADMPHGLLNHSPLMPDFARHEFNRQESLRQELSRSELATSDLPRPEPHRPEPRAPIKKEVS